MSDSASAVKNEPPFLKEDRFAVSESFSLHVYRVPSTIPPKGVVFFGHGMVEHSGRYVEWGRHLSEHGWSFYAVDHRGHGQSDGPRLWMDHYSDLVDDFVTFVEAGAAAHPGLPVFIAGMSMGGGIAVQAAVRLQKSLPNFSGTILIAPGLAVDPHIFPILRHFICILDFFAPRLRLVRPSSGRLTNEKEILEGFRDDPYVCRGRIPVHFGAENARALPIGMACAQHITKPVLICQGRDDRIVYPPLIAKFFDSLAAADKTLKLYDGVGHDVIHEKTGRQSWNDILNWLDSQFSDRKEKLS